MDLNDDVLLGIQEQDPAIASVEIELWGDEPQQPYSVGESISNSLMLKNLKIHVRIEVHDTLDELDGVQIKLGELAKGMANNTSLEDLTLEVFEIWDWYDHDVGHADDSFLSNLFVDVCDVFHQLFPLFTKNDKLRSLSLDIRSLGGPGSNFRRGLLQALESNTSLRRISVNLVNWDPVYDTQVIEAICEKELCELTLKHSEWNCPGSDPGSSFGNLGCSALGKMLSNPTCNLASLELSTNTISEFSNLFWAGLSQNASVKRFELHQDEFMMPMKLPISLEQLQYVGAGPGLNSDKILLAVSQELGYLYSLTKLRLRAVLAKPKVWRRLFESLFIFNKSLHTLHIDHSFGERCLLHLSSFVNKGIKSLKSLTFGLPARELRCTSWETFFRALETSACCNLEELDVCDLTQLTSDAVNSISSFLSKNQNLKILRIDGFRCQQGFFEGVISSNLQEIEMGSCLRYSGDVSLELRNMINKTPNLRNLSLSDVTLDGLGFIIKFIESPTCVLETLDIEVKEDYINTIEDDDWDEYEDYDDSELFEIYQEVQMDLMVPLRKNTSLKVLRIKEVADLFGEIDDYLEVLCDKSSVEATFFSNHTLQSVHGFRCESFRSEGSTRDVLLPLRRIMHLNQNKDKCAVARRKIILCHPLDNINLDVKVVPHFMSWIGREVTEFTLMYREVNKVLHLIL